MKHVTNKFILFAILFSLPLLSWGHNVSLQDQTTLVNGDLWSYIYVGAKHMVTGYDHLLFLAGVIFYLSSFKDIVRFITVFTVAHCITLLGATCLGITADVHLVDALIALSVVYKGFENLGGFKRLGITAPNLLSMVFFFGLIHGFGLSTKLQSFDVLKDDVLPKVLCFNAGVELGQIVALIPIVLVLTQWRKHGSYRSFHFVSNTMLVVIGLVLFGLQMSGYMSQGHV